MSSIFEAPPHAARSRLPSGLPQIAAAFAAGIVVAIAVARPGAAPEPERAPAPVQTAAPATAPNTKAPAAPNKLAESAPANPRRAAEPAPPVEASPAARAETSPPTDSAQQAAACNQQWPYLGKGCGEPDTNTGATQRTIRVIGVDQTAPSSVVAESKPQPAALPPKPGAGTATTTTTATATPAVPAPAPSANDAAVPNAQNGAATTAMAATPEATTSGLLTPADTAPSGAPGTFERVPMPAPNPKAKAAKANDVRPASAKPRVAVQRETTRPDTVRREATRPDTAEREMPPADRATSRKAERRQVAEERPRRDDTRERNEADGFALVRSHTLPDGRRVTVFRKYERDASIERRPLSRGPFGGLFGEVDEDD